MFLLIGTTFSFAQSPNNNRDISYMTSGGKLQPLQAIQDIRHYTLALTVDIEHQSIQGTAEIDLILSKPTDTLLFDLVHLLTVSSITINKQPLIFQQMKFLHQR